MLGCRFCCRLRCWSRATSLPKVLLLPGPHFNIVSVDTSFSLLSFHCISINNNDNVVVSQLHGWSNFECVSKSEDLDVIRTPGVKYLEENGKKEGVVTTETGLQYKV